MNKREKDFSVKEITNGFVVTYLGRKSNDDWVTYEEYVENLEMLFNLIERWYAVPVID